MHPETTRKMRWSRWSTVIIATVFCLLFGSQAQAGCEGDFKFSGTIQILPSTSGFIGDWTISGRIIHVGASTEIERENNAPVIVGAGVEVEGCLQTDDSVIAKHVKVKSANGGGTSYSFSGAVEFLPNTTGRLGDWKVAGVIVHVAAATYINQNNGSVSVGVKVEVEGSRRADGSVDAYKIEVKSDAASAGEVEFTGVIESLPSTAGRLGQWSVSGRKVNVASSTHISPSGVAVAIGFSVKVKGVQQQDGSINAAEIEIKSAGGGSGSFVEFKGVVEMLPGTSGQIGMWTVSGRKVNVAAGTKIELEDGPVTVGSTVEVKGALQADASINAIEIEVEDHSDSFEFYGKVEGLPVATNLIGDWRVGGRTIRVVPSTRIVRTYGAVTIGAYVKVYGVQQSDGSITATEIEVKQGEGGGAYMNFNPAATVSAASYLEENAPEAIVAAFGSNMSSITAAATTLPLPQSLGDVSLLVDGKQAPLFFISPNQINYQVPPNTPSGLANVVVTNKGQAILQGTVLVSSVAPHLFTANASGNGAPAGVLLRVKADGQQVYESLVRFDAAQSKLVPAPITRRTGEQLFLILFGTGLRQAPNTDGSAGNGSAENVQVTIGGVAAQALFAGPAPGFVGLEQLNIRIPDNAPSNPNTQVVVRARDLLNNLKQANTVIISLQ